MTTSVNLSKGERISLTKTSGNNSLSVVTVGLGWDTARGPLGGLIGSVSSVDLDASALMLDENGHLVDTVYFGNLRSYDGSIVHSGDNRTGAGDGDDESVMINLLAVSPNVKHIVITVNSFMGQSFSKVANAYVRLVDNSNDREIAKYTLSDVKGPHSALIMGRLYRHNNEWKLATIGEFANGRTYRELLPSVQAHL